MPRLIREESQEVTTSPPPQAVHLEQNYAKTNKNCEKRKQSPVGHHGTTKQGSITQKKKKKEKDPNAPKQPRSTYILYTMDARPKIAATGAAVTGELLGEQWRALSAEEKLPYEQLAIDDKQRYMKEKAVYDAKKKLSAECDKLQVGGGGVTASLSHPVKLEQKNRALTHARGDDNVPNGKMEYAELIKVVNTKVVAAKKEAGATTNKDVQPPSQESPESIEVDLLVGDSHEKDELSSIGEKHMAVDNNGNKENNNAPSSSKVGKGLKGLGKSIAKAKAGVPRLIAFKKESQDEENPSKSQVANRAGSHSVDVMNNEGSEVLSYSAKVDEKVDLGGELGEVAGGSSIKVREKKDDLQRSPEKKLKDDTIAVDLMQATAQPPLNSSNDDEHDGTCSQQSADLLSECGELDGTPIASNTSKKSPKKMKAKSSSSDPPQATANLARLTIIPLNRNECSSALEKKLKGHPYDGHPNYLAPVPKKDQTTVRKTITLDGKDAANSVALDEVTLGRSSVTGIRSTLISRQLCTVEMKGNSASITMLKESEQHAIFLNGEPLEGPVGKEFELNDLDILSLYGPVDFAYRVQLSP